MTEHISEYLRRLSPRDPIRRMGNELLQHRSISATEVDLVIEVLADPSYIHSHCRIVATWELQRVSLTPTQRERCLFLLYKRLRTPNRFSRRMIDAFKQTLIIDLSSGILLSLLYKLAYERTSHPMETFFPFFFVTLLFTSPFLFPFILWYQDARTFKENVACIELLQHLNEPHSVGVLAACACSAAVDVSNAAIQALIAVLPTLKTEHYGQMLSNTVPDLCGVLTGAAPGTGYPSPTLVRLILDALEKIGNAHAIPIVQSIAEGDYFETYLFTGTQDEANRHAMSIQSCRHKAQCVYQVLLERQEREQHSGMLLRAASAPEAVSEELLRPASASQNSMPSQLLRASSQDEET